MECTITHWSTNLETIWSLSIGAFPGPWPAALFCRPKRILSRAWKGHSRQFIITSAGGHKTLHGSAQTWDVIDSTMETNGLQTHFEKWIQQLSPRDHFMFLCWFSLDKWLQHPHFKPRTGTCERSTATLHKRKHPEEWRREYSPYFADARSTWDPTTSQWKRSQSPAVECASPAKHCTNTWRNDFRTLRVVQRLSYKHEVKI